MTVFANLEWPDIPWFRANILMDSQGRVVGANGTSSSLTRGRDRELLRALRADADASVVGGNSVRTEGWYFTPRGRIIVISRNPASLSRTCPSPQRVVLREVVSHEALDSQKATTELARTVRETLLEHGFHKVICEGGPTLLAGLLRGGLIDELFVSVVADEDDLASIAPRCVRQHLGSGMTTMELVDEVHDPGITFLRYRRAKDSAQA